MKKLVRTMLCLLLMLTLCAAYMPAMAEAPVVVNIARAGDTVTMDPIYAGDNVDIWMMSLVFEGLVRSTSDGKGVEPCLATGWDVSDDGLTYTFHLRSGVCFSTGTPVTVDDWVYSLNRVVSHEDGAWQSMVSSIQAVKALDADTLQLTLGAPSGSMLANLAAFYCSVVPKDYYSITDQDTLASAPIGTGPFLLKNWIKEDNMSFQKNPSYWDAGNPKADEINFHVVPDDNTRLMQLQSGQVDVCTGLNSSAIAMLQNDPSIQIMANPSTHVDYISFNHTSPKLADVRVRQALNYATDRDAIINAIYANIGKRCASFIWPDAPHYNTQLPTYEYNPEKAKELLSQAGVKDLELNVIITAGSPDDLMQATILQSQWAQVGVKLDIQQLDGSARREKRNGLTFEILFNYLTSDIIDTSELMELVCIYEGSDCWHLGWNGEGQKKAEALVREAGKTMDESVRMKDYTEAQMIAAQEAIIIPVCAVPEIVAVRNNVEGFRQSVLGMYLLNELSTK